jgi:hypothetical protein
MLNKFVDLPGFSLLVTVKEFAFTNKTGSIGLSKSKFNKKYLGLATVKVTDIFKDYETGMRFIGVSANSALDAYLDEVANDENRRIFFSEYEMRYPKRAVDVKQEFDLLVARAATMAGAVSTSNGSKLLRNKDGHWSDGHMTFTDFKGMLETVDVLELDMASLS